MSKENQEFFKLLKCSNELIKNNKSLFKEYPEKSNNYYQLKKLIEFFDELQINSLIKFFSDTQYRSLVTIPEVNLFKTSDQSWLVDIWMAKELFTYLHPFLFNDFFQAKYYHSQLSDWLHYSALERYQRH